MNEEEKCKAKQVLGQFKINYCTFLFIPLIFGSVLASYYFSQSLYQEQHYPKLCITDSAKHYPQAQIFRCGMGFSGSFFLLVFHTLFVWISNQAKKYEYKGCIYQKMYWPTQISVLGYFLMVATIDTQEDQKTQYEHYFHFLGAFIFLISLAFLMLIITILCIILRVKNRQFMKVQSLIPKILVASYIIGQSFIYQPLLWLFQYFQLTSSSRYQLRVYLNMLEWNFVLAAPLWMACFLYDFKDISICFMKEEKTKSPPKQSNAGQNTRDIILSMAPNIIDQEKHIRRINFSEEISPNLEVKIPQHIHDTKKGYQVFIDEVGEKTDEEKDQEYDNYQKRQIQEKDIQSVNAQSNNDIQIAINTCNGEKN